MVWGVNQALKAEKDCEKFDSKSEEKPASGQVVLHGVALRRQRVANVYPASRGTTCTKFCENPAPLPEGERLGSGLTPTALTHSRLVRRVRLDAERRHVGAHNFKEALIATGGTP